MLMVHSGLFVYNVRVVLKPFDRETLTTELCSAASLRIGALTCAHMPGA